MDENDSKLVYAAYFVASLPRPSYTQPIKIPMLIFGSGINLQKPIIWLKQNNTKYWWGKEM